MQIYRVELSNDAYFNYEVVRHNLTSGLNVISTGAPQNYSKYVSTTVKVYCLIGKPNDIAALNSDLQLNPPTKASFQILGASEIYI